MEKCGNLWRQEHETAAGREVKAGVRSIDGGGGPQEMRACSACAGDYEGPDRTAWQPDDAEEQEEAPDAASEEFPVEK